VVVHERAQVWPRQVERTTRPRATSAKRPAVVGAADHPLERAAERVADDVVRSLAAGGAVSHAFGTPTRVHRSARGALLDVGPGATAGGAGDQSETRIRRSQTGGAPLDVTTRTSMAPSFGIRFAVPEAQAVVQRFPVKYRPAGGSSTVVAKDTTTMTYAELNEVVADAAKVYTADEVREAGIERDRLDALITAELSRIAVEAVALVDELNDTAIDPGVFRLKVEAYLALVKSIFNRVRLAGEARVNPSEIGEKSKALKSQLGPAEKQVVLNLLQSGGVREKGKEKDPDPLLLAKQSMATPVTMPGAKAVVNYLAPTAESNAHVGDAGIVALRVPGALADAQLHWVINALVEADKDEPGTSARWFHLLDEALRAGPTSSRARPRTGSSTPSCRRARRSARTTAACTES
jgi:hypothetical protein